MTLAVHSVRSAHAVPEQRKRAVVLLTPWFPNRPEERNGSYIYESAAALARRGLAVHVLVCRPWLPPGLESHAPEWMAGVLKTDSFPALASVSLVRYPGLPGGRLRAFTNWSVQRCVQPVLTELIRKHDARLIHAHTEGMAPAAVTAARQLRCRSIVTIHGLNTDARYLHSRTQRAMFRAALSSADRLILVGEPLREDFAAIAGRSDTIRIVPNGVSLPPWSARAPIFSDPNLTRFISVSYLNEGKGVDVTLHALARVRDAGFTQWHYTVVGDGDQRKSLEASVGTLRLTEKVSFLGAQPRDRVFELLRASDVFVLPSYREAFGIAYLEAMVSGLLTIGVRGQGPSAFVEDGVTGLLVAARDPQSLAERLLAIPGNYEAMCNIAAAGCTSVKDAFTWDAHARRLFDVYEELVSW
jgi:glycosyltransferase involved in cell wall biosynthesis